MKKPRIPIWAPYVEQISPHGSTGLFIKYKGGELTIQPQEILSLMLYGHTEPLSQEVMERLGKYGVPIIIHRRNVAKTIWIHSGFRPTNQDAISAQITKRGDLRRRTYIARQLVCAKLKHYRITQNISIFKPLSGLTLDELRNLEAVISKRFWRSYFTSLGHPEYRRRGKNEISYALDAASKFVASIILRWVTYHHLSPYHGFLHLPTDYPSLVYDLMEPYRYFIYESVRRTYPSIQTSKEKKLTAATITLLKELLDEEIYCPQTRQYVRRQELLHGICLALRAYLLGLGKRFVIPYEGNKNGGRPMKTNYTLPGKSAGFSRIYKPSPSTSIS
jgi:CRISPR/Cas system-associated endonuclease Cas1